MTINEVCEKYKVSRKYVERNLEKFDPRPADGRSYALDPAKVAAHFATYRPRRRFA